MKHDDKVAPEGITTDGPTPEQRLAELEDELRKKAAEAKDNYERYVREVADGENFKKRMQREKTDAIRYANESLLRDLLPVVDNLEWALAHAGDGGGDASIVEGVKLTLKAFRDVLERNGVTEVEIAPGATFDPSIHEAVGMEPSEAQPNSVLRVQQRGYKLRDRLLRAARVVVASAPGAAGQTTH